MSLPFLRIGRIQRQLSIGTSEHLSFEPGVNIVVGLPNTGKTKWLQTLDYLLGNSDGHPFEGEEAEDLGEKYDAASVELFVGEERLWVERRWKEVGAKTKIFVNDQSLTTKEFQHYLMEKLGIPILSFPKGNPFSGQTWPELSFRMLLRHIYRQQRFWSDIADQQPEGEKHACLLQFLGIAEHIFTEDYGRLIDLKREVEKLKLRREQYSEMIDEVAREIVSDSTISVRVNTTTVKEAEKRLTSEMEVLQQQREKIIINARNQVVTAEQRGRVQELSEQRATLLVTLEELRLKAKATNERLVEIERYRTDIANELERMSRLGDAAEVMADLRITHCPACDQTISDSTTVPHHCFLCHQALPDQPLIEGLGTVRLKFENDRLSGELQEGDDLLGVLQRDYEQLKNHISRAEEQLRMVENELAPTRQSVSALAQDEISAIDMVLGGLNERQRQLTRISTTLKTGQELTKRIANMERDIEPLETRVNEAFRTTDFESIATQLEEGMNSYLKALNRSRDNVWRHSEVRLDISRGSFSFKVGTRRWQAALGGTDSLYYLMAYHYGLLSISILAQSHYPGISIIDLPGEFAGEAVADKENFIVQPFIELLRKPEYEGAQVIITGNAFTGIEGVSWQTLTKVYVA